MTLEGLYKAQEACGDGTLSAADYKGMEAAVSEAANAAMAHLGGSGRKALEALVAGLVADVAPDPITAEPTPVVVALDRDAFVKGRPERAALIDAFVDARLLTLEGGARLRPTHEALLRIWPEAAKLVKEMGPLIRARYALAPLAQAWAEAPPADKPKHLEIPAPLLASGQQLQARFGEDLGEPLRPFIAKAVRHDEEERARERAEQDERARVAEALAKARGRVAWAAGIGLVVALGLATVAGWQWLEAAAQKFAAIEAGNEAILEKAAAVAARNDAIAQRDAAIEARKRLSTKRPRQSVTSSSRPTRQIPSLSTLPGNSGMSPASPRR